MNRSPLDYWGLVTRSLNVVRDHKILWFFGFFAASGSGGTLNWVNEAGPRWKDFLLSRPDILVAIVFFAVVVWLVMFAMGLISKGALIAGVARADGGGRVTFNEAWEKGLGSALRMLALTALSVLAFFVVTLIAAIPVILPMAAGAAGIAISVLIGAVLFFPYVAFLFALTFVVLYAERSVVLDGLRVFDALRAGWELTRTEVWKSLAVWLVSLVSNLAFMVVLVVGLLVVAIPFFAIGAVNLVAALAIGIPVGLVIVILYSAAVGTYNYSLWTLAWSDLTGAGRVAPPVRVETAALDAPRGVDEGSESDVV